MKLEVKEKIPAKVNKEWLEAHEACEDYVKEFEQAYPEGVEVTLETLKDMLDANEIKYQFDIIWFLCRVLEDDGLTIHELVCRLCYPGTNQALDIYNLLKESGAFEEEVSSETAEI